MYFEFESGNEANDEKQSKQTCIFRKKDYFLYHVFSLHCFWEYGSIEEARASHGMRTKVSFRSDCGHEARADLENGLWEFGKQTESRSFQRQRRAQSDFIKVNSSMKTLFSNVCWRCGWVLEAGWAKRDWFWHGRSSGFHCGRIQNQAWASMLAMTQTHLI